MEKYLDVFVESLRLNYPKRVEILGLILEKSNNNIYILKGSNSKIKESDINKLELWSKSPIVKYVRRYGIT